MTRKKWTDLRDAHLRSDPEAPARYARARQELEAELAAYAAAATPELDWVPDLPAYGPNSLPGKGNGEDGDHDSQ
jgi:hypothetical protein